MMTAETAYTTVAERVWGDGVAASAPGPKDEIPDPPAVQP